MNRLVIAFFFLVISVSQSFGQTKTAVQNSQQQLTRILFLFDASQSMFGRWESNNKFEIAKKLLSEIVDSLHTMNNVEMALHIYGHTKKFPPQDCDDNQLEVPFGKANGYRIKDKLNSITPSGTTPIAQSLEACGKDFPEG